MAAEWAGFSSVGQCEFADYPTKVLEKHWPNVPRWRDVRDVTAESVRARGITNITVLSGGFPCQPFSVAGRQRGKDDDRYLWPEMLRVISELQPTWVLGENVSGFTGMVQFKESPDVDEEGNAIGEVGELFNRTGRYIADEVLESLEEAGYEVQTFIVPACAVDAQHQRKRVFVVGYSEHDGLSTSEVARSVTKASDDFEEGKEQTSQPEGAGRPRSSAYVADSSSQRLQERGYPELNTGREETATGMESKPQRCCQDVANTTSERLQGQRESVESINPAKGGDGEAGESFNVRVGGIWPTEPDVGRVANGVPSRVDRLKCLGNAVVPQQVYPILQAIADIERSKHHDNI